MHATATAYGQVIAETDKYEVVDGNIYVLSPLPIFREWKPTIAYQPGNSRTYSCDVADMNIVPTRIDQREPLY